MFIKNILKGFERYTKIEAYMFNGNYFTPLDYGTVGEFMDSGLTTYTIIDEDSDNISAGEKQLLTITRAMVANPPMMILDEATSSIDTRTEVKIQEAFAKLMEGRVSFLVAHRLSTIRDADVILVMKDGNIIEQGNHESLLEQKGFYYTLYNSQ